MADSAAALVIQISADIKAFVTAMKAATGLFDAEGKKIEKRQKQLAQNIKDGFDGIGKYLAGGAALYGLEKYVSGLVEFGGKMQDVADATKISTDAIQAFGLMASRNGLSQDDFNAGLEKFTKNMGDAAIKGGDLLKFYEKLGVNVKGDATQAIYQFADAVAKTKSPQQQLDLVTTAFGKNLGNLTPILRQGSAALKDQVDQMKAAGQIASAESIAKLDDLGDAWTNLKRQFTVTGANAFAEPLSNLTKALSDPEIQSSLKRFGTLMGELAVELAKVAKYAPIAVGAFAGLKLGRLAGPEGAAAGAVAGGALGLLIASGPNEKFQSDQIDSLNKQIAKAQSRGITRNDLISKRDKLLAQLNSEVPFRGLVGKSGALSGKVSGAPGGGTEDHSDILGHDAQRLQQGQDELANLQKGDAKEVGDATLKANADIRQDNQDTLESRISAIKAQDDALLQDTRGTEEYGDLQKKVIEETASLDIQLIEARKAAELKAIDERSKAEDAAADDARAARKRQLADLVTADKITPAQANTALASFDDAQHKEKEERDASDASRRVALEQSTTSQIVAIHAKAASDIKQYDGTDLVRDSITQGKQQIQQYQDETAQLGLTAGAVAKLAFMQNALNDAKRQGITLSGPQIQALENEATAVGNAAQQAYEANLAINKNIQLGDELRSGLEDVGAAGLKGFGSLEDAAKNFIGQLAEMILRLYVLKPLLEGLLGPSGSSLGLGGIANGIASFFGAGDLAANTTAAIAANPLLFDEGGYTGQGGKHQVAGFVHRGEGVLSQEDMRALGGPRAFMAFRQALKYGYADGGVVGLPSVPALPKAGRSAVAAMNSSPSIYIDVDARYSTKGVAEEINDRLTKLAPIMIKAAVETSRKEFPSNLSNTIRDKA